MLAAAARGRFVSPKRKKERLRGAPFCIDDRYVHPVKLVRTRD